MESPQERKVRLAKLYLEQIEREEEERLESEEAIDSSIIRNRLRQDVLESTGRLIKKVSDDYVSPAEVSDCRFLKNGHRLSITCLVFCNSSKNVFTGGKEGRLIKWCSKTCRRLKQIPEVKKSSKTESTVGHSSCILSLALSSDSKFLASSDESKEFSVWDPETLNLLKKLDGHRSSVTGLAFRKSSHTLYSCSKDRTVKVWNLDEFSYVETLFGHNESITAIHSLFRERCITSGGSDSTLRIWKIVEESQLVFQASNGISIDCVQFLDEQHFVSGADDGLVLIQ